MKSLQIAHQQGDIVTETKFCHISSQKIRLGSNEQSVCHIVDINLKNLDDSADSPAFSILARQIEAVLNMASFQLITYLESEPKSFFSLDYNSSKPHELFGGLSAFSLTVLKGESLDLGSTNMTDSASILSQLLKLHSADEPG